MVRSGELLYLDGLDRVRTVRGAGRVRRGVDGGGALQLHPGEKLGFLFLELLRCQDSLVAKVRQLS
jgi:hypothetical protein